MVASKRSDCPRIGLEGIYKLVILNQEINIQNFDSGKKILAWKLPEIKKYGCFDGCFFVLAGSKAGTGDGKFTFYTVVCQQIVDILTKIQSPVADAYAHVQTSNKKTLHRDVKHEENYIPVKTAPPLPPQVWGQNNTESTDNVYDHFNSTKASDVNIENVYGIGSAKPLHQVVPKAENPYEENPAGAYESVGFT